jgi:xanthine dehydrogenase accessory factor
MLESAQPTAVRLSVSFAGAVFTGSAHVEEAEASLASTVHGIHLILRSGRIPVLVDPDASSVPTLHPSALIDAIVAKRNTGTSRSMAPTVIALGPGFTAGEDAHAVVETNRGPNLGRVYWTGSAEPDSGVPGPVVGKSADRVLRAAQAGVFRPLAAIGDVVEEGQTVGAVEGSEIHAPFKGLIRGLLFEGVEVTNGMKVGDIDPRPEPSLAFKVSDKALAVAGGVLEALLSRTEGTHR